MLKVEHSDTRRSLKAALNGAHEACCTDLVLVAVADVVSSAPSLASLFTPAGLEGLEGECGEAVRGVDWQGQPLSAMGGIH